MPEWVVVVTCQGQPFYYPQKNLLCGLVALTWHYLKKRKYGTMNFKLEQKWRCCSDCGKKVKLDA